MQQQHFTVVLFDISCVTGRWGTRVSYNAENKIFVGSHVFIYPTAPISLVGPKRKYLPQPRKCKL